jgi:epoxyqueuosine reductase
MLTAPFVKAAAREIGFDLVGIAPAVRHPKLARLASWIAEGRAGDMTYLADSLDERLDPAKALPSVRSIVSVGCLYNTDQPYSTDAMSPERASIARYAWGDDYHDVMRERLRALVRTLADRAGRGFEAFSCVDAGPVQERVFAELAGLGWIGKNTCLINPSIGSWIVLGEVLINVELESDAPGVDHCGTCTRCLDACPTGAIVEPWVVDARRCISYLTIEARGPIDDDLQSSLAGRVFGCDICQDVCPWNRRAPAAAAGTWQPRESLAYPKLIDLCRLSDEAWRTLIRGSAMRRAGLRRIRRSLACAAGALDSGAAVEALDALGAHPSAADPLVADAIAQAETRARAAR